MIVGYCRASTDKQQLSVPSQVAKLQAYAQLKDITLSKVYQDEATTSKIPLCLRKDGAELCSLIKSGKVTAVVVVKLDRAFRNTVECLSMLSEWDKRGVQLHIIDFGGNTVDTQTATGRLMITFLAGMAEWERATIGERTKAALAHKKGRMEKTGGDVPYGRYCQELWMRSSERILLG